MANENEVVPPKMKRPLLLSNTTWIVCAALAVVMGFNNAVRAGAAAMGLGTFIPYMLGGCIGAFLLLLAICSIAVLIGRWINSKRSKTKIPA